MAKAVVEYCGKVSCGHSSLLSLQEHSKAKPFSPFGPREVTPFDLIYQWLMRCVLHSVWLKLFPPGSRNRVHSGQLTPICQDPAQRPGLLGSKLYISGHGSHPQGHKPALGQQLRQRVAM